MIFDSLVVNRSMTIVGTDPVVDDESRDMLVVVAKLSFGWDERQKLRLKARPIRWNPVSSEITGIRYPRDYSLPFPGTECLVVGHAHPSRETLESKRVSMRIGPVQKAVRLFGPRVYMKGPAGVVPGPPARIVPTSLSFDHCYGGSDFDASFAENPIGTGFRRNPSELVSAVSHWLEPIEPLGLPLSAGCFAPIDANWSPRTEHSGTFDSDWRRRRAPAAPRDRDPRHHRSARPEQCWATPLKLPFNVELRGFGGDDEILLDLPKYAVDVVVDLHGSSTGVPFDAPLARVLVDVDERIIELGFLSHVPLPTKWEKLKAIRVLARDSLPEELQPTGSSRAGRVAS